ncbi:hypothetical protein L7F22_026849 [Adiantum nelumboides]|nr:hypothetical protein [Adiantum nelumboides]
MYQAIEAFKEEECSKEEIGLKVRMETKYKNVAKKVKPVASPLPPNNREKIEQASLQPSLRNPKMIGHKFTQESFKELQIGCEGFLTPEEKKCFEKMLAKHVPKAHLPKLVELLNEKIKLGILEPSCAPYSNRWFTVPKKNGELRFIQVMQPVNKVTIRNVGTGPIVDEFAEAFARKAIYSMGNLYSGYD